MRQEQRLRTYQHVPEGCVTAVRVLTSHRITSYDVISHRHEKKGRERKKTRKNALTDEKMYLPQAILVVSSTNRVRRST